MIEAIEFTPKVGMNVFMMEFFIPVGYYRRYYNHGGNTMNRTPEPVSDNQILQWKRQCESEISMRGLMFHDIGHGWTAQPFGIDTGMRGGSPEIVAANNASLTEEQKGYLALVNGERKLWIGYPNHTQFCMSNPKGRRKVAKFVADYAENHTNSDYLHVWLADGVNNHCECEECKKKTPSDWYVILLNEIDEELTKKNLNTRIVYIAYTETMWAPEKETLKNPKRFALLFAPISRDYSYSLRVKDENVELTPYVRNKNLLTTNFDELYRHFKNWTKDWSGANLSYEYHFWRHMVADVSGTSLAKVINEDIKFYKESNINGVIEDGSQRSFFPTGQCFYTYARSLFDVSLTEEEIREEYFSCAFGPDWRKFYDYLEKLGAAFDHEYVSGDAYRKNHKNTGHAPKTSVYYDPSRVESLKKVREITEEGRKLIKEYYNSDYRIRTVSVRILEFHAMYADLFADALIEKAQGHDDEADAIKEKLLAEAGKFELAFERMYDQGLYDYSLGRIFAARTVLSDQENITSV
jgi:hypothetical protein